ncbi:hypothetical protein EVAR_67189_1 [Eumeta japonica]|uniref:Uncharacterized protein n=1 Tax=Eumeta variegata TaxID=151549 RepID=A0A4C2A6F0_EUMVA|nr:hypothetical protein EVAR_67189_1 [Eumeta japonica]
MDSLGARVPVHAAKPAGAGRPRRSPRGQGHSYRGRRDTTQECLGKRVRDSHIPGQERRSSSSGHYDEHWYPTTPNEEASRNPEMKNCENRNGGGCARQNVHSAKTVIQTHTAIEISKTQVIINSDTD